MARYCFYCGRELASGEKCDCRHHQTSQPAEPEKSEAGKTEGHNDAGQSRQYKSAGSRSSAHKKAVPISGSFTSARRFFALFNPFTSASGKKKPQSSRQRFKSSWTNRADSNRSSKSTVNPTIKQDAMQAARALSRYLAQPADEIRLTAESGTRRPFLGMLLFQAVLAGLILVLATEQPHLRTVLGLNIASAQQGGSLISRLFLFTQGAGISMAGYLLQILLYHLLLRHIFRQAVSYLRLLKGLSASCFFSSVFLLSGILLISGSFFGTLLVVTAAYAMSLIAQALALRHAAKLDENQVIVLVAVSALIFCSVIALIFNLSLPVLDALLKQSIII